MINHPPRSLRRTFTVGVMALFLSAVVLSALAALVLWGSTKFGISPRPAAILIKYAFNRGGDAMSEALVKHVPPGVVSTLDERYDANDGDALLDVFYPSRVVNTDAVLPLILWVHGGGWVSGDKSQVANYLRILASKGYTVVGVNYAIAPHKTYPVPLRQVNAALAYLQANAKRLHIDSSRIHLAGDSAGAQIAAQVANIVSVPSYAQQLGIQPAIERGQLRGVILYCGAYNAKLVTFSGPIGVFMKTVLWSYAGKKDFLTDLQFQTASVIDFVTPAFPPTFISVGNGDPLAPQSRAMAQALEKQGVKIDGLFFPVTHKTALPHEYQFNLDTEIGWQALERSLGFISKQ